MHKIILLATCFFAGLCLYGQESESGFVIRLDGNYNETTSSNMLQFINANNTVNKGGNVSLSAGYMYKHWLFGLGFEYSREKATASGLLYDQASASMEQSKATLNMYGGMLYTNYYFQIYRNLYFTPGFYIGYGNIKGDYSGTVASLPSASDYMIDYPLDGSAGSSYYEYRKEISSNYFYMQLSLELVWFFSNRFALNAQLGGLSIGVIDFDWSNSSKQINFNPSFWKLGILFKI